MSLWRRTNKLQPDDEIVQSISRRVLGYQDTLLTRLDKNLPATLLFYLWAISGYLTVVVLRSQKILSRDHALTVKLKLAEECVLKSISGFGSMNSADIEGSKEFFDSCWDSCKEFLDAIANSQNANSPIPAGLISWSKSNPTIANIVDDERVGPLATVVLVSLTAETLESIRV